MDFMRSIFVCAFRKIFRVLVGLESLSDLGGAERERDLILFKSARRVSVAARGCAGGNRRLYARDLRSLSAFQTCVQLTFPSSLSLLLRRRRLLSSHLIIEL